MNRILRTGIWTCVILVLIAGCATPSGSTGKPANPDPARTQALIDGMDRILSDLVRLTTGPDSRNVQVKKVVADTMLDIRERRIRVQIDPSLPASVFTGVGFTLSKSSGAEIASIAIAPDVVDLYTNRPSIVLSAIVHEMQHSRSYAHSPDAFRSGHSSTLEKYLYELDAYNLEAQFIRDYILKKPEYTPTKFELFLEKSFTEDYLSAFSYAMLGYDMELAGYLYRMSRRTATYEDKLAEVDKVLDQLLAKPVVTEGDPWELYVQMVPAYSFLQFAPQALRNIDDVHGKLKPGNYDLNTAHPDMYKKILQLDAKFAKHVRFYAHLKVVRDAITEL